MKVRAEWYPQIEEETLSDGRTVWVARHPELPGVIAQAESADEAIRQFQANAEDFAKDLAASGLAAPLPTRLTFEIRIEPPPKSEQSWMAPSAQVAAPEKPQGKFEAKSLEPVAA